MYLLVNLRVCSATCFCAAVWPLSSLVGTYMDSAPSLMSFVRLKAHCNNSKEPYLYIHAYTKAVNTKFSHIGKWLVFFAASYGSVCDPEIFSFILGHIFLPFACERLYVLCVSNQLRT